MTNTVAHSSKRKPIAILTEESKAKSFAINKARTDIDTIIKESGSYHVIQMGSTSRIGFFRVIKLHRFQSQVAVPWSSVRFRRLE